MAIALESCPVCGGQFADGEGVNVLYSGQLVRLGCAQCAERFQADPERYLSEHPDTCCPARKDGPVSEWRCE